MGGSTWSPRNFGKSKIKFPTLDAHVNEKWDDEEDHGDKKQKQHATHETSIVVSKLGNLLSSVRSPRDVAWIQERWTAWGIPFQKHDTLPVIGTSDFPNKHLLHRFVLQLVLTLTFDI